MRLLIRQGFGLEFLPLSLTQYLTLCAFSDLILQIYKYFLNIPNFFSIIYITYIKYIKVSRKSVFLTTFFDIDVNNIM